MSRLFTLLLITLASVLSACSTVDFDEIASAGAGVGGCMAGSLVAGPGGCLVVGGTASTATIVVTKSSEGTVSAGDLLDQVPEEDRAALASEIDKHQAIATVLEHWGKWIIGGIVGLVLFAWIMPGVQIPWLRR